MADKQDKVTDKASGNQAVDPSDVFKRDTDRMVKEIDAIVSGDWGFSVTDDMVNLQQGGMITPNRYKQFTQTQAEGMADAIGKVYMIAHAIYCGACGAKYRFTDMLATDPNTKKGLL